MALEVKGFGQPIQAVLSYRQGFEELKTRFQALDKPLMVQAILDKIHLILDTGILPREGIYHHFSKLTLTDDLKRCLKVFSKAIIQEAKDNGAGIYDMVEYINASFEQLVLESQETLFKTTVTSEETLKIADDLRVDGKTEKSIQAYYKAMTQALQEEKTEISNQCFQKIQELDPSLELLDFNQKMHVLSQIQVVYLQAENAELKNRLEEANKKRILSENRVSQFTEQLVKARGKIEISENKASRITEQLVEAREKIHLFKTAQFERVRIEKARKNEELSKILFGKAKWVQYFGDVGAEPFLPDNIMEILNAPCPIWPGKRVIETHLLTLIPQTVNGQPLTLKTLEELVQKPRQGHATKYKKLNLGVYQDQPTPASHWTLLSRDVVPGSRNKSYTDQQQQLVRQYPGYEVPHILDATVAVFMEYVQSGTRLYSDSPLTYARCQEKCDSNWQLAVGGFAAGGLGVDPGYSISDINGVGVQRKFSDRV